MKIYTIKNKIIMSNIKFIEKQLILNSEDILNVYDKTQINLDDFTIKSVCRLPSEEEFLFNLTYDNYNNMIDYVENNKNLFENFLKKIKDYKF